jgi:hypothetical protein
MQEWDRLLRRESDRCGGCGRRFQSGQTVSSHLEWGPEGLVRHDACGACPDIVPAHAFAAWKRRIGSPHGLRPPRLELGYLTGLLKRLDGQEGPTAGRLAYVVALLLLRRRVLEPVAESPERLHVRLKKEEREFVIPVPVLDPATVAAMETDIQSLLQGDGAAAP